jgi:ATP-binding cassette subfamily B protein
LFQLWKNLKPYQWLLILVISIIVAKTFADLMIPNLLKQVVNLIPQQANIPAPIKEMIAKGAIALLAVLGVITAEIGISFLSSKIAFSFGRDLRKKVFEKVQNLSQTNFEKIGTASLITRTINDITQMEQVTMIIIRMMFAAPIMLVGGAIMAYRIDAQITFVTLGVFPVLLLFIGFIGAKIIPLYKKMQKNLDNLTRTTKENITGVRVIRAFHNEEIEREKFNQKNKAVTDLAKSANRYMAFTMPTVGFLFNLVALLVIWLGASGATDFANINAILQYSMRIMISFIFLIMMFIFIPRASASAARINEVLKLQETIFEVKKSKRTKNEQAGTLEFDKVTFQFEDAEEPTLKNISFKLKKGQTFAIVGGTGSGKSTILNLLPRFYDVTKGQILLDGVNIKDYTLYDLRDKIAIVPQKAVLFNRTIEQNIAYGNENATKSQIVEAAKIAQAHEFILQKEGGYDHMIEKNGANLSGGQKQRLAIARALVKQAEVILFDDSFSALDLKTESKLRHAMMKSVKNAISIIVAQRISSIQHADQILVLDDGNMVGIGTHDELLKNCTTYQEIYASQTKHEEVA